MFRWLKRMTRTSQAAEPAQLANAALARRYLALARSGALRARYDAAVTTTDNRRHWANADALSADAAASADVRRTLRNRLTRCTMSGRTPAWMGREAKSRSTHVPDCLPAGW